MKAVLPPAPPTLPPRALCAVVFDMDGLLPETVSQEPEDGHEALTCTSC